MKPSEKQLNGVGQICKSKGFYDFIDWLTDERKNILEAISSQRDVITIHQLQGQAMIIKDLVKSLQAIASK